MNTPSINTPYPPAAAASAEPLATSPELSGVQPADLGAIHDAPALADQRQPSTNEHAFDVVPEDETQFRQVAEQMVRARFNHLYRLGQQAVAEAIELGGLLSGIKAQLGHGHWLPFLQAVGINERTAQNYLLLYKHQEALRRKYENSADLTLTGALHVARRLNKAQPVEPTSASPVVEGAEQTVSTQRVSPLLVIGALGASLEATQVEDRLRIARTIPPMKDYNDVDRAAFETCFRRLADTLYRMATEGEAGHVVQDDVLFAAVDDLRKFLVRRRKEAQA